MATINKTGNTAKPTGLTLVRNGLKFTVGWKVAGKDYGGGQQVRYRTNLMGKGEWSQASVASGTTAKTFSLSAASYNPTTKKRLTALRVQIRGKRAQTSVTSGDTTTVTTYNWSDWSEITFSFEAPNRPSMTASWDNDHENVTTFSWNTTVSDTDHGPFVNTQWQSMLVRACATANGSSLTWKSTKLGWDTGTSSRSSSVTFAEDNNRLATDSYTRWVRIRSRGAGGNSAWRYAKHVYAWPNRPEIYEDSLTTSVYASSGATMVYLRWKLTASTAHPADQVLVQYYIGTPEDDGLTCPSGANWVTAATLADTTGDDAAQIMVDTVVGLDECLWVQVVACHDNHQRASESVLARKGRLTPPSALSVAMDGDSTNRVIVAATNNSAIPDAHLAVWFRAEGQDDYVCGIIPNGTTPSQVTVQCDKSIDLSGTSFGVQAFQGSYKKITNTSVTEYTLNTNATSARVWTGGTVPSEPDQVSAVISETPGEVILTWRWKWTTANRAEVSWSDNPNAWESTDQPSTYVLNNSQAARLRISDLALGKQWYFRVRLGRLTDGEITYGPYCDPVYVNLSTAPQTPALTLSKAVVTDSEILTLSWTYLSDDGTAQKNAQICEATVTAAEDADDPPVVTYGTPFLTVTTAKHADISASRWETGTIHQLAVRVTGDNNLRSEWSDPAAVTVADPVNCVIASSSLTEETVTDPDETTRTVTALTAMPLTVTVTGAGAGGTTSLVIERAEEYRMERPDGVETVGYAGETVALFSQMGEDPIVIDQEDLIGSLDDGAAYRIVATVQDDLGQSAAAEQKFTVLWDHQAVMPTAEITVDNQRNIALITAPEPEGAATGDVIDIYRLSADRPELIVSGGTFGVQYVDPYPAIGAFGGHRVVFRTVNGDYITADNHPAWIDVGKPLDIQDVIVDFDGVQLRLPYNLDLSSSWRKDFQETTYLGGSVQGDWNPAVSRTGSIGTTSIVTEDPDTIRNLRRLAVYAGICHVRTPDGSSYAADVQVSETRAMGQGSRLANFSLSITRVDPEGLDGLTYEQWAEEES